LASETLWGGYMNPLPLRVPPRGRVIFNYLCPTYDPLALTQDIALVSLPNNVFIDVGWYPEHDPHGAYRISVYQHEWDNQLLANRSRTANAHDVPAIVHHLAERIVGERFVRVPVSYRPMVAMSGSVTDFKEIPGRKLQYA